MFPEITCFSWCVVQLVAIQNSQFSVPEYCDYLRNLDVEGDKFKQEQLDSWLTRLLRIVINLHSLLIKSLVMNYTIYYWYLKR